MGLKNASLDIVVADTHDLLQPPAPAYSDRTVRRAFIVWMHLGQTNKFREVCNYYHRLEALEETMTQEQRAVSRHAEMELFVNNPETTAFADALFPNLYPGRKVDPHYIEKVESIRNNRCVFKLEGFQKYQQAGTSRKQLNEVSKLIRQHCVSHNITLRRFHTDFKEYSAKCGIQESVTSVAHYIKRKSLEAELTTVQNYTNNFNFLDISNSSNTAEPKITMVPMMPRNQNELETNQLKMMLALGARSTSSTTSNSSSGESQSSSCAEFFKLFNKKTDVNNTPETVQTVFESFAAVFKQQQLKKQSMEYENIWVNMSSLLEQKKMYGSMNTADVRKFRQ